MVPETGIEPVWGRPRWILSPVRLPISPLRQNRAVYYGKRAESQILTKRFDDLDYLFLDVFDLSETVYALVKTEFFVVVCDRSCFAAVFFETRFNSLGVVVGAAFDLCSFEDPFR